MRITGKTSFGGRRTGTGFLMLLSFLGVAAGTAAVCVSDNVPSLSRLFFTNNIFKSSGELSFAGQFFRTFLPIAAILTVQFFAGFFAFGQVFGGLTVLYRSMVSGISASLTYLVLGLKGAAAVGLSVLPLSLISCGAVILGARETVRMSGCIAQFSFFGNTDIRQPDVKLYLIKFGVLTAAGLIGALGDTLLNYFTKGIF